MEQVSGYDEAGEGDNIEIQVIDDSFEQEDDDKVTLTKDELAKLQAGADSTSKMGTLFEQLLAKQGQQQVPVNEVVQQKGESDAEFEQRIEDLAFKPGGITKAIAEVVQRSGGGVIQDLREQVASLKSQVARQGFKADDTIAEYADEIDEIIKQLPVQERGKQQAYDWAVGQVKVRHFDEIMEKKIAKKLAEAADASVVKVAKQPSLHMDRGGVSGVKTQGSAGSSITQREAQIAEKEGISKQAYARLPASTKQLLKQRHGVK